MESLGVVPFAIVLPTAFGLFKRMIPIAANLLGLIAGVEGLK